MKPASSRAIAMMWVAYITYIGLASGFAYLAAMIDACSRSIVGYALSRYIVTELALAALDAAVESRRPEPGHCIHHSDCGCQNEIAPYREALERYGLIGSVSAVENPYDNAQAETFY